MTGSAKAGGGGGGDSNSNGSATTSTRWCDGNAKAAVMDGNEQCNGNVTATTAMEGVQQCQWMAQRQRDGATTSWRDEMARGRHDETMRG